MNRHYWLLAALCGAAALFADEPATVNRARVNVRGGPSFNSEVIAQLQKGDAVTFIEEVPVEKPKPGEPAKWAAIRIPTNTAVWVFTDFLNDKTVKVPRLNLRAGPGENYSVVGRLERGDTVKDIRVVEGWMQIEPPDSARAFIDASYLTRTESIKVYEPPQKPETTPELARVTNLPKAPPEQEKIEPAAKAETPKDSPPPATTPPAPTTTTVIKEEPPIVATPAPVAKPDEEKKPATPLETAKADPAVTPPPATPTPAPEKAPEVTRVLPQVAPPIQIRTNTVTVKRVVRREGEVRSTKFNIQAPTYFELVNVDNGKIINYLSGEKAGFKLKDYKGLRVIVTGEEFIEPRYPERPLLEIETIEVAP